MNHHTIRFETILVRAQREAREIMSSKHFQARPHSLLHAGRASRPRYLRGTILQPCLCLRGHPGLSPPSSSVVRKHGRDPDTLVRGLARMAVHLL